MPRSLCLISIFLISLFPSCKNNIPDRFDIAIPAQGNSWIINDPSMDRNMITKEGIRNWSDSSTVIRIYFRSETGGRMYLGLKGNTGKGRSLVRLTSGSTTRILHLEPNDNDTIPAGFFELGEPGYHFLEMQGMTREGEVFADISELLLARGTQDDTLYFVRDDFYFGRRGPSVHLRYDIPPECSEIKAFYGEITVPKGSDIPGSYFMACGFGEGYFGIQVNSMTERRILFSVWSPFRTDDPDDIPEDQRILLLEKGPEVNTGNFGNEGSGGQSFRRYYWHADSTYRFLLLGEPSVNSSTDYSAWFYAPEEGKWQLIATFRRPKTTTYLKNLYSFLENFLPETGNISREALYSNQWILDTAGRWHEMTGATFTADATARKDARLDYSGGSARGSFFLKNCGFFSERTSIGKHFEREPIGIIPDIGSITGN